jgi:hypothetical protein
VESALLEKKKKKNEVRIFHHNASRCDTIVVQFSTNVVQMIK